MSSSIGIKLGASAIIAVLSVAILWGVQKVMADSSTNSVAPASMTMKQALVAALSIFLASIATIYGMVRT